MMKPSLEKAFNDQIQAELFSFYLYLSMAAFFKDVRLDGFSHWMSVQSQEEMAHALKLLHHLNQRGARVRLQALEAPPFEWSSPAVAVQAVVEHERYVTGRIHSLLELAEAEKDHAAAVLLHWFVNEQVEEEESSDSLYHQVKAVEGNPAGLLILDRELAQRPQASAAAAPADAT
jgi:ferritin